MSLYLSINTAKSFSGNRPIDEAITFVAAHAAVEKREGRIPSGPSLDITFMIPGEEEKPDFSGMRMGGYTREGDTLFFEAAVPEHILSSPEAPNYVAMVLQEVIVHANEFFQENQITFDKRKWHQVMFDLTEISTNTAH